MSKELVLPYFNLELYDTLLLEANQMNNNIYINLKENLKKKILDKCINLGYVVEVYNILEYDDGILEPENFEASAKYNIKYNAKICNPIEDTFIVCKIVNINKVLIKAINGPILIIIKSSDINEDNFKKSSKGDITYNNEELKIDDHIIIRVIIKRLNYGDTRICTIGFMEDMASKDDIINFYNN
tara:strand:+ start:3660 stop:4214 length:555 start_codon:yes stop_codon:yes gene_type:complete